MAAQKQIAANRRNAQLSTGPLEAGLFELCLARVNSDFPKRKWMSESRPPPVMKMWAERAAPRISRPTKRT
jgi:hypothetical protein